MSEMYTEMELDVLKEIINIGGGNVATSISKLLNKRVDMDVPVIVHQTYEEVFQTVMPAEMMVKAVQIHTSGDLAGAFLYILHEEGIMQVASEDFKYFQDNPEIVDSALCELANILVNSFLNAVTRFLNLNTQSSVPYLAKDMFGSLLTSAYLEELQYDDRIWIFKNDFWIEEHKWDSSLYFVPQKGIFEKLINTIM